MEQIKENILGVITFIAVIILFLFFLNNIYIFGAIYIILFITAILIYIVLILKKNKYKELLKKINIGFLIAGVLSILFGTQMLSYGIRYIRYGTEILFNKTNYSLFYDELILYDSSHDIKNEYMIEKDNSCTEYLQEEDINKSPCEIILLNKEDASLRFSISNYMGKIEYKINNSNWKNVTTEISDYTIKSKYIGLFKNDYIEGNYYNGFDSNNLKNGKNIISIKYREKEEKFVFNLKK